MDSAEAPVMFDFDIVECFPEEFCRNVFSNLTPNELLSASLVSKNWCNLIERAPECMKKLTLKFANKDSKSKVWPSEEIIERLTTSTRKYENIQLCNISLFNKITSEVRDILEIRGRKWKKVEISFIDFESWPDLFGVLSYIEKTVEELEITHVGLPAESEIERFGLTFPKLKVLTLLGTSFPVQIEFAINCTKPLGFLVDCTTLKEFTLTTEGDDDAVNLGIHEMLKRNKGLKELSITTSKKFYNVDVSEGLQFKLATLKIRSRELNANQKMNLQKFLRPQLRSLKYLKFSGWLGLEAAKMIFHMPNLTRLKLVDFDCTEEYIDLKTTEFRSNATITDLHLFRTEKVDTLQAFFPVMTKVKHLEVCEITEEILYLIAETYPNLESLTTSRFKVTDVSDRDILKKLKKLDFTYDTVAPKEPSCHFGRLVDDVIVKNYLKQLQLMSSSPEGRSRLLVAITVMKNQPNAATAPETILLTRAMKALRTFEP